MKTFHPALTAIIVSFCFVCSAARSYSDSATADRLQKTASMSAPDTLKRELGEVSIVADRKRSEDIVPHQKLSGQRLEGLSAHSVADAIRYFAGVQLKDYGGVGGLKTVDMRSMGSNHMGVFYDGIQLGNAQNGQVDLGKFSMDNIEEISLYNGQKSGIFQPAKDYGSSGTIYLRSRTPRFMEGKRRNVQAVCRTGSFGLRNPSLLWEERLSDRICTSLSAERTLATGKYRFRYRKVFSDGTVAWDTTATRQNGDIAATRIEGGLYGRLDDGQWRGKIYYYESERGIPGAIVNNVWKHSQRQWDKNFFAQGSVQKAVGRNYEAMLNAKFAYDRLRYLNPDTTLMYVDNTFRQREAYLSLANHYKVSHVCDLSLAADYQWNALDASLPNFAKPQRHTTLVAAAGTLQWQRVRVLGSLLGTMVRESAARLRHADNTHAYTPALFLYISPLRSHDLSLRAFGKRTFRMPTFNDLYYTDLGNIALRPEQAEQYDIGLSYHKSLRRRRLRRVELKADAYRNRVSDKIIAVPKGNGQYRWMMMNLGEVHIFGLEFAAQAQGEVLKELLAGVNLNYTYQRALDYSDPSDRDAYGGTYKGQIAYVPRHSGSITANIRWHRWRADYSFIYVGERYHNSANIRANHEEPWYTHDLGMSYDFRLRGASMSATIECCNLLDQQYDVVLNYPMPGRNWRLTAKVKL